MKKIKKLKWFIDRIGKEVHSTTFSPHIDGEIDAHTLYKLQTERGEVFNNDSDTTDEDFETIEFEVKTVESRVIEAHEKTVETSERTAVALERIADSMSALAAIVSHSFEQYGKSKEPVQEQPTTPVSIHAAAPEENPKKKKDS